MHLTIQENAEPKSKMPYKFVLFLLNLLNANVLPNILPRLAVGGSTFQDARRTELHV